MSDEIKKGMWCGKVIEEMTREEAINALVHAIGLLERRQKEADGILSSWETCRKARNEIRR